MAVGVGVGVGVGVNVAVAVGVNVAVAVGVNVAVGGEVRTLNQQSGDPRNSGDVLKKTPATRGTRRGRLGILKLIVEFYG